MEKLIETYDLTVFYDNIENEEFIKFLESNCNDPIARAFLIEYYMDDDDYDSCMKYAYAGVAQNCPYAAGCLGLLFNTSLRNKFGDYALHYATMSAKANNMIGLYVVGTITNNNALIEKSAEMGYPQSCEHMAPIAELNGDYDKALKYLLTATYGGRKNHYIARTFKKISNPHDYMKMFLSNMDKYSSQLYDVLSHCQDLDLTTYYEDFIYLNNSLIAQVYFMRLDVMKKTKSIYRDMLKYKFHPGGAIAKELEESFNKQASKNDNL